MGVTIEIKEDRLSAALARLQEAVGSGITPLMQKIGEEMVERVRERFTTGADPDGQAWAANSAVTMQRYLASKLLKKSQITAGAGGKKPLFGVLGWSGGLAARTAAQMLDSTTLELVNPLIYAGTQQFGATMGAFGRYYQLSRLKYGEKDFRRFSGMKQGHPIPWGNIPARRFMPLSADAAEMSPAELKLILAQVDDYLRAATGSAE